MIAAELVIILVAKLKRYNLTIYTIPLCAHICK
jgi:hypothetical protein